LKKIPETTRIEFQSVSAEIVEQANPIPDVLARGRGVVHAFEAPYYCEKCRKTLVKILQPAQIGMNGAKPVAPEQTCPTCSSKLKFDGIPEEYFYFLKWLKRG
jgi:hypothetical protein